MSSTAPQVRLVPPDAKFAEEFMRWREDADTRKYNPLTPSTIEKLRDRLAGAAFDLHEIFTRHEFMWMIEADVPSSKNMHDSETSPQTHKDVVGQISIGQINKMMLTAELGYTLAPEARGRGLATMAVQTLTDKVFHETNFRKLIAHVHEGNLPSRRVLEKCGYQQEGTLREHYLINGNPVNEVVYGILKHEWKPA